MSLTIKDMVNNWLRDYHATNTKPVTHDIVTNAIDRHLIPRVGHLSATDATPKQLLSTLNEIPPPATRKRLLQHLTNAYDYACVCGDVQYNPASSLSKYLKTSDYQKKPYAVLQKTEWSQFFRAVEDMIHPHVAKLCFWALAYSALRRSECIFALKSEFNFNAGTWTVPAARMKNGSDRIIYLAPTITFELHQLFISNDSQYAFPSPYDDVDNPLNPWSIWYVIKKSGYATRQTPHGLRKIFSSHAHESGLFSIDAIELSLDHKIHGVRGDYNLAKYEAERRHLMRWWGFELDKWRGLS